MPTHHLLPVRLFVKTALPGCLLFLMMVSVAAQTALPPNMYADSLHAPFYHGVASGDPLPDRVIIWTRISPQQPEPESLTVTWQIATDTAFTDVVNAGTFTTSGNKDWTVKVDVAGLQPDATCYYRFISPDGAISETGRTKTASQGNVNRVRLGIGSCSSIYSGYFNAYHRLSERSNLDAFIHLGDYIYDFVDENEQLRVPVPYPQVPNSLQSWRNRHAYYLLDPDLRAARAAMPWIVIWDNHDINPDDVGDAEGARQAFWEYLPIRQPDTLQNSLIYRSFRFGNLVQLLMLDVLLHRTESEILPGVPSMLGNNQYNWLTAQLLDNAAQWRVIGSQKMVGTWSVEGLPFIGFGNGSVADLNSWDGFAAERERLLLFLHNNNLNNNIFISGDAHISMCMDLPIQPANPDSYNPTTGEGSMAVEFLPTSITRGNFDEAGLTPFMVNALTTAFMNLNPHEVFTQLTKHGYGILDIAPDSTVAQIWYSVISTPAISEELGISLVTYKDENHWRRPTSATTQIVANGVKPPCSMALFPNPAHETVWLQTTPDSCPVEGTVVITDVTGKPVTQIHLPQNNGNLHEINLQQLPPGCYWLHWQNAARLLMKR